MIPIVSVITVVDYAGGETFASSDLLTIAEALARQDTDVAFELLVVESDEHKATLPSELEKILPSLRIVLSPAETSYELKNAGVRAARGHIIVILDADCTPAPDWLRQLVDALSKHPEATAISGRTVYEGRSLLERILAVLSRAYLDPGGPGKTRFLSNNNAAIHRDAYLANPLPAEAGPFGARLQSEAMLRGGAIFYFEPKIRVTHKFEGWQMERDIRRNIGYATVKIRQMDPKMPYAWMARLGPISIPLFLGARTVDSWWDCLRAGKHYGLRWFEMPIAFIVAGVVHVLETDGMIRAFRNQPLVETAYR